MIGEVNVIAQRLMDQGKLQEALETYKNTIVYDQASDEESAAYQNMSKIHKKLGNQLYSRAMTFQATLLKGSHGKYAKPTQEEQREVEKQILKNPKGYQLYYELACKHILQLQMIEACIYYKLYKKYMPDNTPSIDEVGSILAEYEYVERFFKQLDCKEHTYCVIVDEGDKRVLVEALAQLGQKVYAISIRGREEELTEESTENIYWLAPEVGERNRSKEEIKEVLYGIYESYCQEDCWIVLGEQTYLNGLLNEVGLSKIMQKIYTESVKRNWACMGAYFIGNYLHIAKYLYGFDVPMQMKQMPQVKVSIVIPVKSYTYTLKDTLQTCLKQREGNYEIVLSDNGEIEDKRIYDLVQELNDARIRYYKTPYTLPLVKSFEYAYLRARGEFIFSLGADDAVLPYTVKHLEEIIKKFPDDNVIAWPRLFYVWPEFKSSGIADTLSFPQGIEKDKIGVAYMESDQMIIGMIEQLNQRVNNIYSLPMCYINSGMRRGHILKMIECTGKFLEGNSQDVYTGIVNVAMYDRILFAQYPLTVAGMSNSSIGAKSVLTEQSLQKYKGFVEAYNSTFSFVELPSTPSQAEVYPQYDYALFVYELLKVCDLEINEKCSRWKEQINFNNLYEWIVMQYYNSGPDAIETLERHKACAYAHSEQTGAMVEQIIRAYGPPKKPAFTAYGEPQEKEKAYFKGSNAGWLTLDAEEFGVKNVREAVALFVKMYNL